MTEDTPPSADDNDWLFRYKAPFSRNPEEPTCIGLPGPRNWGDAMKEDILQRITFTWSLERFNQSSDTTRVQPDASEYSRHGDTTSNRDQRINTFIRRASADPSLRSVSVPAGPVISVPTDKSRAKTVPRELPSPNREGDHSQSATSAEGVQVFQKRKFQKYRDTNSSGGFYWIGTSSDQLLDMPTTPPDQAKAKDLLLHRSSTGFQVWIRSSQGTPRWLRVGGGYTSIYERYIAITEGGRLTLVKEEHWKREYKKDYDGGKSPIVEP
ncbi:hypothetical protein CONPUDRAFT_149671 [Coniophora puteana RWD-64-598 SS2]|uniref:Uncharacterized protein n=1 Tax=Coniophora puteana (strain RWD-64-598) TaxID=741705 RepID=A0A5M3N070_CONPW|nr:uncharacterized protein CONPUDRAFT_149671 [Coniophora puteana RWD-64-598 SS2]EIW84800.1 hypothetical protein CONPUDRAFT_149671 [Coniophora puteana RWD-64-598 SS2]